MIYASLNHDRPSSRSASQHKLKLVRQKVAYSKMFPRDAATKWNYRADRNDQDAN